MHLSAILRIPGVRITEWRRGFRTISTAPPELAESLLRFQTAWLCLIRNAKRRRKCVFQEEFWRVRCANAPHRVIASTTWGLHVWPEDSFWIFFAVMVLSVVSRNQLCGLENFDDETACIRSLAATHDVGEHHPSVAYMLHNMIPVIFSKYLVQFGPISHSIKVRNRSYIS